MKKIITSIIILILIAIVAVYFISKNGSKTAVIDQNPTTSGDLTGSTAPQASSTPNAPVNEPVSVIGKSVEGKDIVAYHYGTGSTELLFVGGIHGGYGWNTVLLAGQLMDYLQNNPAAVPANVKVTIIPVLNPDGLNKVVGTSTRSFTAADVSKRAATLASGRFNADKVDLNRNFDCDWQANAILNSKPVSGGASAFSEPESQAIKSYVDANKLTAVIVWYSAAGGVYASNCHGGVSAEADSLTKAFAAGSGYPAHESFDFYATTGDMTNWLAKMGIPAAGVLLTNHTDTDWTKNLGGVQALLKKYAVSNTQ